LEGELTSERDVTHFRRAGLSVALPHCRNAGSSRRVVLGLRAEDVHEAEAGDPTMAGIVDTAMPGGSDIFLGLKVCGADVFVRVGKDASVTEGQAITLGLNPTRLHLFDLETGISLLHGHGT
jgi:multiple sugar transport system ATP-binding protein